MLRLACARCSTGVSEGTAGMEDTSLYLKLEKPKGLFSVHVHCSVNYCYNNVHVQCT